MKIRLKLALLFTSLFITLLFAFSLILYFSYSKNREGEYYKSLKQQAVTEAYLLLNMRIQPSVLRLVYKNSLSPLLQKEVAIYDQDFHLLYHDPGELEPVKQTREIIDRIIKQREIKFQIKKLQALGFLYRYEQKNYIVVIAAKNEDFLSKIQEIKYTLFAVFIGGIIITLISSRIFAMQALKPIARLVDKVEEITATNLDLRVNEGNGKDELAELVINFNRMLDRLESSFDAQKDFVSNISHELRTPLSAMIGELELALTKTRNTGEYIFMIKQALSDAKKLARLSNGLLDFAKASYDQTEIKFKEIRLDELLLDARQQILKLDPNNKVNIIFDQEIEDEDTISVIGNEYLLKVAFINLIENGCKYSNDHQCIISISFYKEKVILRFADTGVGIPPDELSKVFIPFFRGSNKNFAEGYGIGLPLTKKIVQLHKGKLFFISEILKGTTFTLELPNI
jgi:signal transduction histidine kinase